LDDLDFADDLGLLSHTRQQMQEKTNIIATHSASFGLIVHKGKSKILKVNNNTAVGTRCGLERQGQLSIS